MAKNIKVAMPYANAFIQMASTKNSLDTVIGDLTYIEGALKSVELVNAFNNPLLQLEAKKGIIKSIFQGKIDINSLNFLLVLCDRGSIICLETINSSALEIAYRQASIEVGYVVSSYEMSDSQQEALVAKLKAMANVKQVKRAIEQSYGIQTTVVKATMPESASAHDRGRYNANKILDYLQQQYPNKQVIALTSKDICTNLNGQPCWGVLGLSNLGKPYSVSSVSRIKSDKENLLSKVAIHEVGHGLGLPHCKSGIPCLMKDAESKITTIKQQPMKFCKDCSRLL
jgi:ATP synthase F1 delta subunit